MSKSAHLLCLLREAVQSCAQMELMSEVGIVLSGGLDSSSVACIAAEFGDFPCFTGYYDEPGFSERQYARLIPASEHHYIRITPDDFVENFDAMVPHLKEPWQGMGAFGQYMVGKYLRRHGIKVALSGEGADELFGGYPRLLKVAGHKLPDNYQDYVLPADYPRTVEAALAYDYERLADLLAVDDQCMRAHGIEARAPFTDHKLVDWALRNPPRERVGKKLLRDAVRGVVPDKIIDRTDNCGFPIPLVKWANNHAGVRDLIRGRIGYLPDPERPWDRGFWHDLLNSATMPVAA